MQIANLHQPDIEKYGSGFKRILNELKQYPTMNLECKEIPNGFLVKLSYIAQKTNSNIEVTHKVTHKVTDKVTDNQKIIVDNILKNNKITTNELAEIIGISQRKIKENINKLKIAGLLSRIGPTKGGYWEITDQE